MKNKFFIIAAIIIAVTAITIVSCKKDKTEESSPTENIAKNYELSDMDKAMIAFGEKMKAASNEKSGESMPLADALNTLSNYQNFTMCDASHFSTEMMTDTFKITLNVCNGQVLLSELYRVYEATKPEILAKLNSLDGDEKAIYIIKTVVDETPRNGLNDYNGLLDAKVVAHMMDSYRTSGSISNGFDNTDYWYNFNYAGKCDDYAGQYIGRDCVTELNRKMRERMQTFGCGDGYTVYFTNTYSFTIRCVDLPNSHSYWPWCSFFDCPTCVSPNEMTTYLNNVQEVYDNVADTILSTIIDFHFYEHQYHRLPNENYESYAVFTIGDYNCTPVIPDE